ncbi:MAG: hypothetical protein IKJ98_04690 [Bacteroidales bacterium]|nr:hypothetical protein [Bacteroidales bacterium]
MSNYRCPQCGRMHDTRSYPYTEGVLSLISYDTQFFCSEGCRRAYKGTASSDKSTVTKSVAGGTFGGVIAGGIVNALSSTNEEKAEKAKRETMEKQKEYEGMEYNTRLLEDLSTITFDGDANQTANQLNMLFSQSGLVKKSNSNESNHKEVYKAIVEKVELGIMHLQSLNDISHVEYFQKKLKKFKLLKVHGTMLLIAGYVLFMIVLGIISFLGD